VRYQTLGGVFRNGEARAELGEGRTEEWLTRWGRTAEAELGAPMATAVPCARRAWARERERKSWLVQMAVGVKAGAVGRTWWPSRARPSRRMRATRQPNAAGVPRRRSAAVRARGRGAGAGAGELGQLRPASAPFPFSIF